ncbi:hypothetical protein Tco_0565943 [Tanacetum coccineum]
MSSITDIKSTLTLKALKSFCEAYHIPDEVHPQIPTPNQTIHEMPAGKIGVYTRFFEYANFRLPLSTFLVNVLKHYRIHISQLSVLGAAKVSHFEILCRVHGFEPTVGLFRCFYVNSKNKGWVSFSKRPGNTATCYTKPLDSLKNWNDRFFWVDAFACPASFPWNASTTVSKDPFPKSSQYNAEHYATLVAYPAPFHKYPEPFLCLVGISRYYTLDENTYPQFLRDNNEEMDLFAFILTADPTKVMIGERQRSEDEPRLLDTTVGRTVPLLPVAPARAQSELDASVDRLFDEEGSGNEEEHHDSADGGQGAGTLIVSEATKVVAEDVIRLRSRQRKRKTIVDADELSHPAKKLRDDHGAPDGPSVAGKSRSTVQRLLAGAVLNAEVRGEPVPTLPFVTSSVSATPEREDEHPADSVTGLNLRTICAPQRFVISSDSSHHSGANIAEAEVDSIVRSYAPIIATVVTATADVATTTKEAPAKEALTKPSLFSTGSSLAGGTDPIPGGFSDVSGSDFLVGGIRTVVDPEFDLQKVYVPQWSVTNGSRLDDACQISLSAKVRMRAEYNIKEKRRLKVVVEEKDILLKTKGEEIDSLNAQLLLKEAEAAEAIHLRVEASRFGIVEKSLRDEVKLLKERNAALEEEKGVLDVKVADLAATVKVREQEAADSDALVTTVKLQNDSLADQVRELEASSAGLQEKVTAYEKFVDQLEKFQDDKIKEVNDKLEKLDADVVAMVLHLEEKFYPHLLNTIAGRRWLLTHGMELAVTKCLNSTEYLSALGAAIGKAVEKGMQEGLSAGITHGIEGRTLTDIAAYNPSAEADYLAALHHLQSVNFSLLAELKSNKDASTETIMNLLRLEDRLADRLGLTASQPRADQLMVPIHHSPDHRVIGASALSLSLDVSNFRVRKIKENLANRVSALRDVFIPLSEPLSVTALTGTEGTSAVVAIPAGTTTALSVTFASTSVVRPISTDDYEIVHVDGQRGGSAEDQIGGDNVDPFPNVDNVDLNLQ